MTVEELIARLKECPPDMEVTLQAGDGLFIRVHDLDDLKTKCSVFKAWELEDGDCFSIVPTDKAKRFRSIKILGIG